MSSVQSIGLVVLGELLERVDANRLQHAEPAADALQQALVEERAGAVERRVADADGGLERAAAGKDREVREQALLLGLQEVVAPGDRVAKRLVTGRFVTRSMAQEVESLVEPIEHLLGRKELRPRGCELEGKREAVEARADLLDGGRVLLGEPEGRFGRLGALDEQGDRVHAAQRVHGVLPLSVQPEGRTARDEEGKARRGLEHLREQRRRLDQLLEVVQQHEHAPPDDALGDAREEGPLAALADLERLCDLREEERRVADRVERDEEGTVRYLARERVGRLDREPCLPGAPRARQRQQPHLAPAEGRADFLATPALGPRAC